MPPVSEPSDETLLRVWQEGDTSAFEVLFRRWQGPLHRHLSRMLDDPAAADDLVIETFLRLQRHRARWRPGTPLRPWLFTIARNLARNRLRAERLWGWLPLTVVQAAPAPPPSRGADGEIRDRVAAAFAELPPAQREACSLRLLADMPLTEIARVTRVPLGTVKSRLFHGLRQLRAQLSDLQEE
jgi:RNA polymerase sigma-70 factor (ECF subfamily)